MLGARALNIRASDFSELPRERVVLIHSWDALLVWRRVLLIISDDD